MARTWYGGTLADYSVDTNGRPVANAKFDVWTGPGGGVQITDLLDATGEPVTQATADNRGFIRFQPPEGTTGALYLQDADERWYAINPMGLADIVAESVETVEATVTTVTLLAGVVGDGSQLAKTAQAARALALTPELLAVGAVTRDGSGAPTAAALSWPDGATGAYTADAVAAGAVNAYHVTHILGGVTTTYTQPAVTRDGSGNITNRPAMVES